MASVKTTRDESVHKLWLDHKELMRQEPPALVFPERLTRIVSSSREEGGGKSPSKEYAECVPIPPRLCRKPLVPRHGLSWIMNSYTRAAS